MFRLQDNVPSIYVEKSRDFQLLLRLIDGLQGSIKYNIDSMISVLDPFEIRDDLLNLLSIKVGFFPSFDIESTALKNIVAAFPYVIKNKGSEAGIKAAVRAIIKSEFSNSTGTELDPENNPKVVIYNGSVTSDDKKYSIEIYTDISDYNLKILQELMEYIRPIGYNYNVINTPSSAIATTGEEEYLSDGIITSKIENNATLAKIIPNQLNVGGELSSGQPFGVAGNSLINTAPNEQIDYQLSKHAMVAGKDSFEESGISSEREGNQDNE